MVYTLGFSRAFRRSICFCRMQFGFSLKITISSILNYYGESNGRIFCIVEKSLPKNPLFQCDEVWNLTYSWVSWRFFEQIFQKTVGFYKKSKRFWKLRSTAFKPCTTLGVYLQRELSKLEIYLKKSLILDHVCYFKHSFKIQISP